MFKSFELMFKSFELKFRSFELIFKSYEHNFLPIASMLASLQEECPILPIENIIAFLSSKSEKM